MGKTKNPVIYIVDDESVRRAIKGCSAPSAWMSDLHVRPGVFEIQIQGKNSCMIVDIKLEGKSGPELQDEFRARGSKLPVIFITGYNTPETRDQAKKIGACRLF